MKSVRNIYFLLVCLLPTSLVAGDFPTPTDVRVEGSKLIWNAVPDAGGYNIYWEYGYLTTVKGRTDFDLQLEGFYQVVAFDESGSIYSTQFADGVSAQYDGGGSLSVSVSSPGFTVMSVVTATCQNVGPGESCVASCSAVYQDHATGGACSTSDIVEADAIASVNTYSCTVPTFSGEVTAQVFCLDVSGLR